MRFFEVLAKRKYGKRNFRSLAVKIERKCGSEALDLLNSLQSGSAEAELQIVGSHDRTEVRKRNFISYEESAEQKRETEFMSHHW